MEFQSQHSYHGWCCFNASAVDRLESTFAFPSLNSLTDSRSKNPREQFTDLSCKNGDIVASERKTTSKKRGSKLSVAPQSVAARHRRQRIRKRFKILQTMVPGGNKMDTVSMLDGAIQYVKFLKTQIWLHQTVFSNDFAVLSDLQLPAASPDPNMDQI